MAYDFCFNQFEYWSVNESNDGVCNDVLEEISK